MQTFSIHYPQTGKGKMKVIPKPTLGHYPVALIPGQFTDHYRTYSSNQLKYMPLNTAIKSAPKNPKAFHMAVATAKSNELKRKKLSQFGSNKRPRSDESNSDRYEFLKFLAKANSWNEMNQFHQRNVFFPIKIEIFTPNIWEHIQKI